MTGKTDRDRVSEMQKLRHVVTRASTSGMPCRWSGMAQAILVPPTSRHAWGWAHRGWPPNTAEHAAL